MSSDEEDVNDKEQQSTISQENKKRRIQRACDICRRKKIRCDGGQMPQNRCSNCIAYNHDCTYVEAAKKRGPPKGYVESLENRLENMEKLLQRLCPDADFTQELGAHLDRESWSNDKRGMDIPLSSRNSRTNSPVRRLSTAQGGTSVMPSGLPTLDPDDLPPSDDELGHATLTEGLKRLAVEPLDRRFHGKSSGVMLVQAAMNLKREFSGLSTAKDLLIPPTRRPEFWAPHPWEVISEEHIVRYHYPPDDLVPHLVDNYFTFLNPFLPILHRPSFERALNDRRHHTDIGFGSVVMLVCAVGARWSEDPRVCIEGMSKHSSGWKWFDQVQVHRKSFLGPPRLYDLQIYALSSIFLHSSSSPQSSWTMVGIGIRLAQDVGAHRRKVYNAPLSVESELWKRAFWVLVALDRFSSAALGRPCAIQDEDFDLDLPLEVDDEYWEHSDPAKAFKQPPGVPCTVAYFNCFLKLNQILAFALRTIYSINKSKILLGFVGPQWEQHIVAELDSALNKWIDTVPDHLRWDPHRENFLHFSQSATLYATYYHTQILIHRPFIPTPRKPSPLSFPSLAICTNAARSCSHVADIQRKRGCQPLPQIQVAVFTAGIVLLLNIWGARKSGATGDPLKQMSDVHKCMQVLHAIEERWQSAGRLWDILNELASVGDIPLPDGSSSNKRERDADSPISSGPSPGPSNSSSGVDISRPIAGRRSLGGNSTPGSSGKQVQQQPIASSSTSIPKGNSPYAYNMGGPVQTSADISLPWLPSSSTNPLSPTNNPMLNAGGSSSTMGAQPPPPMQQQTAGLFDGTTMPNINLFDLFQSDPQMFNLSSIDQASMSFATQGLQSQSLPAQGSSPAVLDPSKGTFSTLASGLYPADPGVLPSVNEALQMWSTAPTSFDLEDWGSYLHNVSGVGASLDASQQQHHQQQ